SLGISGEGIAAQVVERHGRRERNSTQRVLPCSLRSPHKVVNMDVNYSGAACAAIPSRDSP
ncbi:MAG: hypothetical protein ACM3QW_08685, partial [Ignavibacteriales bacterium]